MEVDISPHHNNLKAKGHDEYKAWLKEVGSCFSPLFPCEKPLRVGMWTSWTVEGLYQGLKLFSVEDLSLIHTSVEFQVFCPGSPSLIHIPGIMKVNDGLAQNFLFRLLKSGRKYDSKRNQYLGRLVKQRRNWDWTRTWRSPILNVPITGEQFREEVFVPALYSALSQRQNEVRRLRKYWSEGQYLLTQEMRLAHDHLKYVEKYVLSE